MSRSRLLTIITARLALERQAQTTTRMMAYESAADETAFVIGPFLVGILALIAPWAPIAIAAALSFGFVSRSRCTPRPCVVVGEDAGAARRLPRGVLGAGARAGGGDVRRRHVLRLALTSLTAFAQARGDEAQAGLLYGLMGIGSPCSRSASCCCRRASRCRAGSPSLVVTIAAIGYATADSFASIVVWLLLMGLGVGPTLVTLFSLAGARRRSRRDHDDTARVGAHARPGACRRPSLGWLAEAVSLHAAMIVPAIAGVLVLALGVVNAVAERRRA
jgi:hypothetical protein